MRERDQDSPAGLELIDRLVVEGFAGKIVVHGLGERIGSHREIVKRFDVAEQTNSVVFDNAYAMFAGGTFKLDEAHLLVGCNAGDALTRIDHAPLSLGIQNLESWLRGNGCVPIYNLMDDAATAEISRVLASDTIRTRSGEILYRRLKHPVIRIVLSAEQNTRPEVIMNSNANAAQFLFAFLLASQAGAAAAGDSYVRAQTGRDAWAVGNALVERQIAFDPKSGLSTISWRHKVTGTDFTKGGAAPRRLGDEFSFQTGNTTLTGRSGFELAAAEILNLEGGKALKLRLRHSKEGLEVSVFYAVYDEHPVIRKWIAITNTGAQPLVLKHLCFESVAAAAGVPADLQLFAGYGTIPREIFFTGRVSDTAMVSRNSRTGEGLVVLNEAPGYLKRTEMGGNWNDRIQVMYDTDLFPFERTLEPGETFQSARSSVAFFLEGKGFADPRWVVPILYVPRPDAARTKFSAVLDL